jgi:hypothetical protein
MPRPAAGPERTGGSVGSDGTAPLGALPDGLAVSPLEAAAAAADGEEEEDEEEGPPAPAPAPALAPHGVAYRAQKASMRSNASPSLAMGAQKTMRQ